MAIDERKQKTKCILWNNRKHGGNGNPTALEHRTVTAF
uniref:Uncharacterized protein n=1 Tax=Arundo donax TaxID=35708 RepID=A0A0A9BKP1_ARUDO